MKTHNPISDNSGHYRNSCTKKEQPKNAFEFRTMFCWIYLFDRSRVMKERVNSKFVTKLFTNLDLSELNGTLSV